MSQIKNSSCCPFCGHALVNVYSRGLVILRCKACGLLLKGAAQSGKEFAALYRTAWEDSSTHKDETGGTDLSLAKFYAQKLASALNLKNFAGLKILDFGAGRGDMLTALSGLGAQAYGVEPFGYDYLKQRGFAVFPTLEALSKAMRFDVITMIDVAEHLSAPWETINNLCGLLNPGGRLYLATPNAGGLNAGISGPRWREWHNPSHVMFFTPHSLELLLNTVSGVTYQRLRWLVPYGGGTIKKIIHFALQLSGYDGELRYLLRKP